MELHDGLPKWEMLDLAQEYHRKYAKRVIGLLLKHQYSGVEDRYRGEHGSEWTGGYGGRPGYYAAEVRALEKVKTSDT